MLYEHEYPEFFARFYDTIYQKMRDGIDNQFFLNEIGNTDGRVLEVGTGTGRLFTEALKQGADIYGIDISPAMLQILKQKIDQKYHKLLSVQNIINFKLEHKFKLIIAPFRVFMHVTDKEDQIRALNHVHNYLVPGGKFIFDTFIPDLNILLNGIQDQLDFDEEYMPGKRLRRFVTTQPDPINQIIHVTFRFKYDADEGFQIRKWETPLRYFFRYELEHLIERSAFKNNYTILGDYEGNKLSSKSKEFIVICNK